MEGFVTFLGLINRDDLVNYVLVLLLALINISYVLPAKFVLLKLAL